MRRLLAFFLAISSLATAAPADEITVDLEHPVYQDGVISTESGGVIRGARFRVQAQKIRFRQQESLATLEAEGDLMLEYGDDVFTGKRLEFDLNTCTGTITCARSAIGPWYVGGQTVTLCADRSYVIRQAYITTCDSLDNDWGLYAKCVRVTPDGYISADNVKVRFLRIPIFWIPKFRTHMRSLLDAPIRYRVQIGGTQGTKVGLRYRFFSFRDLSAYLRLEYFLARGPGVALETEYCPPGHASRFYTQSYLAYDRSLHEPDRPFRYRLAGLYHDSFRQGLWTVRGHYDYASDREVATDYRTSDFNLHTTRLSEVELHRQSRDWILNLFARVRLNDFQTVNQQLPSVEASWRPWTPNCSPLIFTHRTSAGYNALAFADDTKAKTPHQPTPPVKDYQSGRFETDTRVLLPMCVGPMRLLGTGGVLAIGYTDSQHGSARGVLLGMLGGEARLRFTGLFSNYKHIIEPYASYEFLSPPTTGPNSHDIFSIRDGYSYLNLLRVGLRNAVYSRDRCGIIAQPLDLDIYAYAFLNSERVGSVVPRVYGDLCWAPLPYMRTQVRAAWNLAHDTIDHIYTRLEATVSQDTAFAIEHRYRSKYVWRKADHTNFILDVARPEAQLIAQLSDRRNILLFHIFHRVTPTLNIELETRSGWRMREQKPFNEGKVSLQLLLPCHWNLAIFYEHLVYDDSFGISLTLGNPRRPAQYSRPLTAW